ncbi:MAG: hypothetical protein O3A14_16310 [Cyanobacteria bacterium]|nr:hypothetical protein [Cyanobacteriota bacterium]
MDISVQERRHQALAAYLDQICEELYRPSDKEVCRVVRTALTISDAPVRGKDRDWLNLLLVTETNPVDQPGGRSQRWIELKLHFVYTLEGAIQEVRILNLNLLQELFEAPALDEEVRSQTILLLEKMGLLAQGGAIAP